MGWHLFLSFLLQPVPHFKQAVGDHYSWLRAALQRKVSQGTRSSRRRCRQLLQRLSGREGRFPTWVNHCISKAIVSGARATCSTIALEDLTGMRPPARWRERERVNQQSRSKTERRRLNGWAFHPLRQFLHYKAVRAGVKVVVVLPAYTSQTCHRCLWLGQWEGKRFRCVNPACGWEGDADFTTRVIGTESFVIALLGAAVNRPAPLHPPVYGGTEGGLGLAGQLQGYCSRQRDGVPKPPAEVGGSLRSWLLIATGQGLQEGAGGKRGQLGADYSQTKLRSATKPGRTGSPSR